MMAAAAAAASGEEEERTPLLLRAGLPPRRPSDDVSARRCYGAAAGLLPPRPGKLVVVVVVMVVLLLALYILLTCSSGPCRRAVLFEDHRPSMWKGGITPAGLLSSGFVAATSASATLLYVSSYAGTVTTLNLTLPDLAEPVGDGRATAAAAPAAATLEAVSSSTGCGESPSWLHLDYSKSLLFCTNEGLTSETGSLASFFTNEDGSLTTLSNLEVILGPVSIAEYGVGGHGLALAQYSGSSVSVVSFDPQGELSLVWNETFTLDGPGPDPERQEAPHPHEALLDPTAAFVLVPDLGADLVRIYQANADNLTLTPVAPLVAAPGSGPRHGVFTVVRDKTYFYLVSELANTITGYAVTYNDNKTMSFDELFVIPTHGDDRELPEGTGAAEIHLSPDEKFLIVSSRWEYSMNITNFDASNSTDIASDPLIVYAIDRAADGGAALTKVQEFPAGGAGPRQFAVNADGDLLAVGLQADGRVVLIGRDVETGMLTNFVAYADIEGEVTAAIFHEDYHSRRVSGGRRVV